MTWSAAITRSTSGTIEVDVEASSKAEAEAKIKQKLLDGEYDQQLMDEMAFNAVYEEDSIKDIIEIKEESDV